MSIFECCGDYPDCDCDEEKRVTKSRSDFKDSAILGAVLDNGIVGGLLGGDIVGGPLGDLANDGEIL